MNYTFQFADVFAAWPLLARGTLNTIELSLLAMVLGLLVAAYVWLQPNPPKRVVLATGPDQSAYDNFGQAYAKALALPVTALASVTSVARIELGDDAAMVTALRSGTLDMSANSQGAVAAARSVQAQSTTHTLPSLSTARPRG